jgi:MFS family permease
MPDTIGDHQRERLLRMLALATFIIFFQAYMVAPIIPALSVALNASVQAVGVLVPAYLIPYGVATLFYGLLADRVGIHRHCQLGVKHVAEEQESAGNAAARSSFNAG